MGRELRPNTVALFGNPRVGSRVMSCSPTAGIDLPQKWLVREGDGGAVEGCDAILGNVRETLDSIAREVAGLGERDSDD